MRAPDTSKHKTAAAPRPGPVYPLTSTTDLSPLLDRIGNARVVMLGEASHGTHEYYIWRSRISQMLIQEKGFGFIAVEGDWPDCYSLNRYIKGYADAGTSAKEILTEFDRWPAWMWANWEIAALAEWMRKYNEGLIQTRKAGFYGLDVYSLWESLDAIRKYLKPRDPAAWRMAERAFQCFETVGGDEGIAYARNTYRTAASCENEVVQLLSEIRNKMPGYNMDHEAVFSAEQNAVIALHAEQYYRSMLKGDAESWNIRDNHMMVTLERLLKLHGAESKAIVWAHNTHIGDARATDMARQGMFNLGELARMGYSPEEVVLVGFGSYQGTVTAARKWAYPMQQMELPAAEPGSWEAQLHEEGLKQALILTGELDRAFDKPIGHRAVGVVYRPEYERFGNYVPSVIPQRYDAFIFIDQTRGLHPIHQQPDSRQMPETYPWGV